MKEIEVKILDISRKEIESKLISLGAKKILDNEINAVFFDFKDGSIRNNKKTIRLRQEGSKTFLTFKEAAEKNNNSNAKIREEHQVEVSDFYITKILLESLGLSERLVLKKHRTSYQLENVHFEIDKHLGKYGFIPEFMEIEAEDINLIYKYAQLLGFTKEDCKPWSLSDLEKHYKENE